MWILPDISSDIPAIPGGVTTLAGIPAAPRVRSGGIRGWRHRPDDGTVAAGGRTAGLHESDDFDGSDDGPRGARDPCSPITGGDGSIEYARRAVWDGRDAGCGAWRRLLDPGTGFRGTGGGPRRRLRAPDHARTGRGRCRAEVLQSRRGPGICAPAGARIGPVKRHPGGGRPQDPDRPGELRQEGILGGACHPGDRHRDGPVHVWRPVRDPGSRRRT